MIMKDEDTPAAPAVEEELEQTVEQLQQHVAALQDKCGRLQAQTLRVGPTARLVGAGHCLESIGSDGLVLLEVAALDRAVVGSVLRLDRQ